MNREIKFRAWNKYDGKMDNYLEDISCRAFSSYENLMQYTGFIDKNNKEIYEGDIVKAYIPNHTVEPTEVISSISFSEGSFIFLNINKEPLTLRETIKISKGVEVVGNLYENPEILTPLAT